MQDSVKGICKIIIRNANGETIFVRDMQPVHKKSSTDSSKPHVRNTSQEDLFYQNMHDVLNPGNIQELVVKTGNRELTFSRVNGMQIEPEKLKTGSAKCRGDRS